MSDLWTLTGADAHADHSTFGMDFTHFNDPLPNTVYACHDYSRQVQRCFSSYFCTTVLTSDMAFQVPLSYSPCVRLHLHMVQEMEWSRNPPADGQGTVEQKKWQEDSFARKVEYMRSIKGPIWSESAPRSPFPPCLARKSNREAEKKSLMPDGEFGPVYSNTRDPRMEQTNESRYSALQHQLEIYDRYKASWAIWLYKGEQLLLAQSLVHTHQAQRSESPSILCHADDFVQISDSRAWSTWMRNPRI